MKRRIFAEYEIEISGEDEELCGKNCPCKSKLKTRKCNLFPYELKSAAENGLRTFDCLQAGTNWDYINPPFEKVGYNADADKD